MQTDTLQIQAFDATTASEKEWDDYISLRQTFFAEREPNDDIPPAELLRKELTVGDESDRKENLRWVIYDAMSEQAIGTTGLGYITPAHEDYEKDKHLGYYDIYVKPDFRRRGIGSHMLRMLGSVMQEKEKTTLEAWVNVEAGLAFQEAHHAKLTLRMRSNRLQLADVDWAMMEQWANEGVDRNPDTQLIVTTDIPSDETLQHYADLIMDVFAQMPKEDAGGFPEVITIDRLQEWFGQARKSGYAQINAYTLEPDGTVSAMSEVYNNEKQPKVVEQGLTGVHLSARGRGLGKWVKAATTLYIRDNFPKAEYVDTENANVNAAMLHINETMGFKFHKQNSVYEIEVADLLS